MIVALCRALAALVGAVLLAGLALAGLSVAAFSLGGGDGGWSLPGLARLLNLPQFADTVGAFLGDLGDGGAFMGIAVLAALGAVVLGVALLVGAFVARRERVLVLDRNAGGTLRARRRALGQAVEALSEQSRDVIASKAKLSPRRRGPGGRVAIRVDSAKTASGPDVIEGVRERVAGLAEAASLRLRIRHRVPRRGGTVR